MDHEEEFTKWLATTPFAKDALGSPTAREYAFYAWRAGRLFGWTQGYAAAREGLTEDHTDEQDN